jgi:hypothetical protein
MRQVTITYTILIGKAQEKRHLAEIVGDGKKVFKSTESKGMRPCGLDVTGSG